MYSSVCFSTCAHCERDPLPQIRAAIDEAPELSPPTSPCGSPPRARAVAGDEFCAGAYAGLALEARGVVEIKSKGNGACLLFLFIFVFYLCVNSKGTA